jgi:acyl carrier protein
MLKLIQEIIYKVTGIQGITYETDFVQDIALNSLDVMNIVCVFEDRLHISIPTRDVWKLHRVKDVIDYLQKRGITNP